MSIRIYSKKAFSIGPGANRTNGSVENFVTIPMAFQDMPEKYKDDPTFKLAVKCGDITVIEKKPQIQSAVVEQDESPVDGDINKNDSNDDAVDPVEKFYEELKGKKAEEVEQLAKKYGAEFIKGDKLSMNKKRVLEAYKLSLEEEETEENTEG